MLGLTAKRLCIYASKITYFAKYACISPAASFSNFQAKAEELAETPLSTPASSESLWALVFIAIFAMYCNCL